MKVMTSDRCHDLLSLLHSLPCDYQQSLTFSCVCTYMTSHIS
nr:MAG TPA: hypothetical protein [Caudoviricetes sp.]